MDEFEFRRLLDLFPIVRSRDYHAESDLSRQSTSRSSRSELREWQDASNEGDGEKSNNQGSDQHHAFWKKLKLAAEKKVGKAEAEKFCDAFQQMHYTVVNEDLSLNAVRSFLKSYHSVE